MILGVDKLVREYMFNGGCYRVERVFSNHQSVEEIVMRKLKEQTGNADYLTTLPVSMYNETGGSIGM